MKLIQHTMSANKRTWNQLERTRVPLNVPIKAGLPKSLKNEKLLRSFERSAQKTIIRSRQSWSQDAASGPGTEHVPPSLVNPGQALRGLASPRVLLVPRGQATWVLWPHKTLPHRHHVCGDLLTGHVPKLTLVPCREDAGCTRSRAVHSA